MNDDIMNIRHVNLASVEEYCREHDLVLIPREYYEKLIEKEDKKEKTDE